MKNVSIIQVVLIGISVVAIFAAVIMFALFKGNGSSSNSGSIILWGTISQNTFSSVLGNLSDPKQVEGLQYVEKDPLTFESDLLKAIAEGTGPDLVLLNEKQIISNQKRITLIPFDSFPLRDYQDLFLSQSSLLVTQEGVLGYPFLVDPLVLYYNKDTLNDAGFSKPPQTWTEVLAITPILTQKDSSFNISKSAIALGSFDNITNAKDIFWTLVLQAGNPVIKRELGSQEQKEFYNSVFNDNLNFTLNPSYAATNFFTQFSNPTKTIYSWNRSLPSSQTMFVSGDLAFYIGKASELPTIKRLNPNLNFDVALMPQSQSSPRKVTYGSMYVLAIPRTSSDTTGAMNMMNVLISTEAQTDFAKALGISSVRKDLLSISDVTNLYENVFNRSAIISQGVLEPESSKTSDIIKQIIDSVVSGQLEISEALNDANTKITTLLSNYNE